MGIYGDYLGVYRKVLLKGFIGGYMGIYGDYLGVYRKVLLKGLIGGYMGIYGDYIGVYGNSIVEVSQNSDHVEVPHVKVYFGSTMLGSFPISQSSTF